MLESEFATSQTASVDSATPPPAILVSAMSPHCRVLKATLGFDRGNSILFVEYNQFRSSNLREGSGSVLRMAPVRRLCWLLATALLLLVPD